MLQIDAWTDIFWSQKRVISNSHASKPGVPGQRRSVSKAKNYPVSAIKTRIDNSRPEIYLPSRLTNGEGSLPVAITAQIGQSNVRLCQTLGFASTRLGSEVSCPRKNPEDPVRLEPRIPGLRVKHFTTEPYRTLECKRREI